MEIPQIIQNIYDTFVEYYKEANVDLQTDQDYYYIIVYWSEVVVTNERNLSITIWDLYSRIQLYPNGKLYGKMEFKRACYNDNQWQAKYVHSHVPSRSGYCNWQGCCTGSGPINHTIAKLMARVYEGNSYTDQKLYEDMTT